VLGDGHCPGPYAFKPWPADSSGFAGCSPCPRRPRIRPSAITTGFAAACGPRSAARVVSFVSNLDDVPRFTRLVVGFSFPRIVRPGVPIHARVARRVKSFWDSFTNKHCGLCAQDILATERRTK
jgi:hypothetical protein